VPTWLGTTVDLEVCGLAELINDVIAHHAADIGCVRASTLDDTYISLSDAPKSTADETVRIDIGLARPS
jgi:hypothetical protein